MFDVFYFGALRVLIDSATGEVKAVQDRISGEAAAFRFSPDYIARASQSAILAFESVSMEGV